MAKMIVTWIVIVVLAVISSIVFRKAIVDFSAMIFHFFFRKSKKAKAEKKSGFDFLLETSEGRALLEQTEEGRRYLNEMALSKANKLSAILNSEALQAQLEELNLTKQVEEKRKNQNGKSEEDEKSSSDTIEDSNPISGYREGANMTAWWIAIFSAAIIVSGFCAIIAGLSFFGSQTKNWLVIIPTCLLTIAPWVIVTLIIIKGAATVTEGYVGVARGFKKYCGTINPGLNFLIPGINDYDEVPVGEQIMSLNLTKEANGDVELADHVSIGIKAMVYYRVLKEGAHMALFNINIARADGYEAALNSLMDSMLRSYVSDYPFDGVNQLRGKRLLANLFKADGEETTKDDWSDQELCNHLKKSQNWLDIRRDWGIEILDLAIVDFIFDEKNEAAWNKTFEAQQELEAAKINVEIAAQEKLAGFERAEIEKRILVVQGEGVGSQIETIAKASGTNGKDVLCFINNGQKFGAIKEGGSGILIDGSDGGSPAAQGAILAAGMTMFNKNNPVAAPVNTEAATTTNDSRKGQENETKKSTWGRTNLPPKQ